jgi:hypothetical protein
MPVAPTARTKNQPGGSRPAEVMVSDFPAPAYLAGAGALVEGAVGASGVCGVSELLQPARTTAATTLRNAIVRNDFFMTQGSSSFDVENTS